MADPQQLELIQQGVDVWNQWRKANRLVTPSLMRADLVWGKLREANLREANLNWANLRDANLHGADLNGADLRGANLRGVNLRSTNLSEANLVDVDFSGANLSEADFHRARIGWATFANVNLSQAKNLDTLFHKGPSTIGIDTLYQSGGKIPEVFLRGVGVADNFIPYIGSFVGKPIEFYSCFISYNHADKAFARRLFDTLQGRGIRCWLDEKQLRPGDDIHEQVDYGIRFWDKILLCCSKDSLISWWVENEIGKAFAKEQQLMKERKRKVLALIPLNLDGYLFKWSNGKASQVRERLAGDFRGWKRNHSKFEAQVEEVIRALRTDNSAREQPPQPRL